MPRAKLTLTRKKCTREGCTLQGEIHPKCKAHNRTGIPCRGQPMNGQLVCRMHGGQEPNALKAARQRIAYQQVLSFTSQIVAYDDSNPETPAEGLLREVSWSAQVALALGEVCNAMVADEHLTTSSAGQGHRLHGLMQAWSDERMNHAKLCKMALDAGIQQQQLDLIESRANEIVKVVLSLLSSPELNLSSDQIVEGRIVAARILRMASSPITY
jgi:hypothetical protein